jgi:cation transport regulator ChaB
MKKTEYTTNRLFNLRIKRKKDIKKQIKDKKIDFSVKLKPVMGMNPAVYVRIIWGTAISLILFFLLFYPGIKNYGKKMSFSSNTAGAALYVDGKYAGSTPGSIFIPAGNHKFTFRKTGFEDVTIEKKIRGRAFFTLIVPSRGKISAEMTLNSEDAVFAHTLQVFAEYTLQSEFSSNRDQILSARDNTLISSRYISNTKIRRSEGRFINPYRKIISETTIDFKLQNRPELAQQLISEALNYCTNNYQAEDILIAQLIILSDEQSKITEKDLYIDNEKKSVLAVTETEKIITAINKIAETSEPLTLWNFYKKTPYETRKKLPKELRETLQQKALTALSANNYKATVTGRLNVGGYNFTKIKISSGIYCQDKEAVQNAIENNNDIKKTPAAVMAETFYILNSEVSCSLFDSFLKETPEWKDKKALIGNGLVDETYLDSRYYRGGSYPANCVSWYAADAFAKWFNNKLPASLNGWTTDLPSEMQFLAAAKVATTVNAIIEAEETSKCSYSELNNIYGNVWEWNSSWFSPTTVNPEVSGGAVKATAGGCWGNSRSEVTPESVGGLSPEMCTPFNGFRIVIRKK